MFRFAFLTLFLLSASAPVLQAGQSRLNVVLSDAVLQFPKKPVLPHLFSATTVDFVLKDGQVEETAWGSVLNFNRSEHKGRVTKQELKGQKLTMTYELRYNGDNWIKGGKGVYEIEMTLPDEPGPVKGSFTGEYEGVPLKGTVTGKLLPPQQTSESFRPIQPGEHPRLLFRADEINEVKARLETPFGKALWPKIVAAADKDDVIAMGFVYAMTGDKAYAEKAKQRTIEHMKDRTGVHGAWARIGVLDSTG